MSDQTMNIEILRQLAGVLDEANLTEIKYETPEIKIKIARQAFSAVPQPGLPLVMPPQQHAEAAEPAQHLGAVKSPMVGNVYLASDPSAAPFVQVNDTVKAGDTLLIIEAMKVMNAIKAPRGGVVTQILVQNANPVEFDEVLLIIE